MQIPACSVRLIIAGPEPELYCPGRGGRQRAPVAIGFKALGRYAGAGRLQTCASCRRQRWRRLATFASAGRQVHRIEIAQLLSQLIGYAPAELVPPRYISKEEE